MPVDCARASPLGNVARETCFGAKHKFDKMPPMNEISDFDAGFICGLVTGEGSFAGDRRQPALAIKLHQDDLEPLLSCKECWEGRFTGLTATRADDIIFGGLWDECFTLPCRSSRSGFPNHVSEISLSPGWINIV